MIEIYLENNIDYLQEIFHDMKNDNEYIIVKENNKIIGMAEVCHISEVASELIRIQMLEENIHNRDGLIKATLNILLNKGVIYALSKESNLNSYGFKKEHNILSNKFDKYYVLNLISRINNDCCKGGTNER